MPGLGTKRAPDHLMFGVVFEVFFEVLISITDIRYLDPNGALFGPRLALFGEIVLSGCTKL